MRGGEIENIKKIPHRGFVNHTFPYLSIVCKKYVKTKYVSLCVFYRIKSVGIFAADDNNADFPLSMDTL